MSLVLAVRLLKSLADDLSGCECMKNMKPEDDTLSGDTTQLLRDILQSKERKELENNNTIKSYCAVDDRENSEMISTMLRAKSNTSAANSDNDNWSVGADNYSGDDSDIDVDTEDVSDISAAQEVKESKEDITDELPNGVGVEPEIQDTKEAKRARVENIITSMRHSPPSTADLEVNQTSPEVKRQKRKQYQPQQHEVKSYGASDPKFRKVERAALHDHIQHLQNQLREVKQKCDDLCEDEHHLQYNNSSALDNGNISFNDNQNNLYKNEKENGMDILRNTIRNEWDPSHFFRQASKLVQEQEVLSKSSGKLSGNIPPPDLHALANSIKTEIVDAISKVVDNAVSKLIEKKSAPILKNTETLSSSKSEIVKVPTLVPKPEKERERKPDVTPTSSLSDLQSELNKHSIASRLSDKISAFEPLSRMENDFPRISTSHHQNMPFHPPFPYFGLPSQMMPPMYAAEPEQTEALPLIVNTPKKKRTKVTDTRLSPRAKSALLQDSFLPSHLTLDQDRTTMMTSFPHLFPPMLPTSVAIPNPGLNHSDIMSFNMRDPSFWESRMMNQSPPHSERNSPKSPAESFGSFRKSDMYDNSPDIGDGSNGCQSISFIKTYFQLHPYKSR
ncbi:hypothetical protein LOTGIDRAFT_229436 [Lottia gigantea]|uniref:Prospero domain-containing protein n=1 Tax=Lottia gigantea TaxID=225164 RepID=V3ZSB4_LOTGI|nr:hypothetical protein LOTGIDRAFT_229436 [Lottia gigantea]ESO85420.1 hypothetical protein LOTGIDRAFT_229436 [Lottia gigantea]